MIIDSSRQVSSDQALTGTSAVPSEHVINLGAERLIGPGDPMWWVIVAKIGLAGTTPTLDIDIETDTVENFASATTLLSHPQLAAADFATGATVIIPMPFTNQRYLRLSYTMGGTTPTCTVDAFLTNQHPTKWAPQPNAI